MIEVRDAKKWIQNGARRVEILKGISLTIPAGQFVAIMGASGSGKSTLLGLLAGLDSPTSGDVVLDGTSIGQMEESQLAAVRPCIRGFLPLGMGSVDAAHELAPSDHLAHEALQRTHFDARFFRMC